jgi:alpha-L-fucosidase 2
MKKVLILLLLTVSVAAAQTPFEHDLTQPKLAGRWDEALPLGNGLVGNLVWQRDNKLRFSLDRADLWDSRPMTDIDKLTFGMIREQVAKKDYAIIQQLGDVPYEREAAPSKIPGAALEFGAESWGDATSRLFIKEGIAEVKWSNGTRLITFVHPTAPLGWFRFEGSTPQLSLVPPKYVGDNQGTGNSVEGQGLARLGYPAGELTQAANSISYIQPGWNGFEYQVAVVWKAIPNGIEGVWAVTSNSHWNASKQSALGVASESMQEGYANQLTKTQSWWKSFWSESLLHLPDKILERQWYLENYKFGCIARPDAPPITLQAVWTADNGNLPPWKGDIHNDLNTQLSYWPSYSGNHLTGARGFTNWLWSTRPVFEAYTKRFFGVSGLAVPGVTTLDGKDMGGWVQYSYSPTVAGWLGHHFYLEWRYSRDNQFLKERAYPWLRDVATFFEQLAITNREGKQQLPLSASPEFYDNNLKAWFTDMTNYDLAIVRWTFSKAAELASELKLNTESDHWIQELNRWPELSLDVQGGLALAPNHPYPESHRHFSHLMGIHPLGLLDNQNLTDQRVIKASMKLLEEKGSRLWVGYSFAWQGNLYARMGNGQRAAETLRTFATCFCSTNSFHLNGDQCTGTFSSFRYRPFTLEGNFAFASGVQEMLLQSHDGVIRIFPAIPDEWKDVSFETLRAEGAFLISGMRAHGKLKEVRVVSVKGGPFIMQNTFKQFVAEHATAEITPEGNIKIQTQPGQTFILKEK